MGSADTENETMGSSETSETVETRSTYEEAPRWGGLQIDEMRQLQHDSILFVMERRDDHEEDYDYHNSVPDDVHHSGYGTQSFQ